MIEGVRPRRRAPAPASIVVIAMILLGSVGSSAATTMRHHPLTELVAEAERVFVGLCVDARDGALAQPDGGAIPYTEYTFEVREVIKGSLGARLTIRQYGVRQPRPTPGGTLAVVSRVPAMPVYLPGQETLLFLVGDSTLGLTSPVGLGQGAFRVAIDGGQRRAVNGFNNAGLFRGMSAAALRGQALAPEEAALLAIPRGPVALDPLVSLVRKLAQ
jgi:hypothetical protein